MKRKYALLLAVIVAVSAMAFRPNTHVTTNADVIRIKEANSKTSHDQAAKLTDAKAKTTPLLAAALQVDSKVLVVLAVGAVTRLIDYEPSANVLNKYRMIMQDIDMRSLDKNK